jgi:hypothetical protein
MHFHLCVGVHFSVTTAKYHQFMVMMMMMIIQFNSVLVYQSASSTAQWPITELAQNNYTNTKEQHNKTTKLIYG